MSELFIMRDKVHKAGTRHLGSCDGVILHIYIYPMSLCDRRCSTLLYVCGLICLSFFSWEGNIIARGFTPFDAVIRTTLFGAIKRINKCDDSEPGA